MWEYLWIDAAGPKNCTFGINQAVYSQFKYSSSCGNCDTQYVLLLQLVYNQIMINRVKAVEAGAVATLVELLLDEGGRCVTELAVVAIDHLCGCAEGRSELVAHPAGLAVVSKKAMRVSLAATESAVRALHAVARHSPTPAVLQEMLAVGVVAKLMLVLQVDAGDKARLRAKEMLKAHARVWKDSPCLQAHLKASYP